MIRLQTTGRLGKDATVNTVNGHNVINFTVAHTERYKDAQGNKQEKTTWIDCSYWVKSTAIAPYLKKGTEVYVEGEPSARAYTTSDGTAKASLSLRIDSVELLGGNRSGAANNGTAGAAETAHEDVPQTEHNDDIADDLPF